MNSGQGSALPLMGILRSAKQCPRLCTGVGIWMICLMLFSSPLAFTAGRKNVRDKPGKMAPADQVLILYDVDDSISWGWIGEIHARMLANLLGHFPLPYSMKPVSEYTEGEILAHKTTFYLGSLYGSDLPPAFLSDVETTENTVCWFKYNMEQIDSSFVLLQGTGSVYYRGKTFTKNPADLELGSISCQPGECVTVARAPVSGGWNIAYILEKANLWYVADLPFSYISEEDRYLVFADALHDILGVTHSHLPRALIRIEDVDPTYPPDVLMNIADYLYSRGVLF
ncbi:MAG TPA: hypothetical protein VMY18_09760, partial [Acidobacteriota bacterium]|nr:hypothetical protein [Acidobacteriota bacterium]